jgi:tetratricopeptide (TPR) repeat protein
VKDATPWLVVKEELSRLLEMPTAQRNAALESLRAKQPGLANELGELLAAADRSESFLEIPAWERISVAPQDAAPPPDTIGPWRIEAEIGRGGMGSVYRARRIDGQFEQLVAIKIAQRDLASDLLRRRFLSERRILASLEHPNIARLIDGGTTADGVPYLALEYVDGEPIDRYCNSHALPIVARLELFRRVCDAVNFAHQKLVLHRDIKAANVLIDAHGAPKLLDFGIAKLLGPEDTVDGLTRHGFARPLTPEWASPEQLRGETLSTAADVYSLGVLLFVLLAGERPHKYADTAPEVLAARIQAASRVSVTAAARRVAPPGIDVSSLRGDLEHIVAKALAAEPRQRYVSAAALADDIARYLSGRTVDAHPPALGYRIGKILRRNRAAATAVALATVGLLAASGFSLRQAALAERASERATRRFEDVRRLANVVLFDLTDALANVSGALQARQLLVENGLRYLDSLAREASDDASLQLELAKAYERIAELQGMPGWPSDGRSGDARVSLERALALRRQATPAHGAGPGVARAEAQLLNRIGTVLAARGKTKAALERHRAAEKLLRPLTRPGGDSRLALEIATLQVAIGDDIWELGDIPGAAGQYRLALKTVEDAAAENPNATLIERQRGVVEQRLGDAAAELRDFSLALTHHRASLAVDESLLNQMPDDAELQRDLGTDLSRVGADAFAMSDYRTALDAHRRAGTLREKLLSADPRDARALEDAAESQFQASLVLAMLARRAEARALAQRAIERWESLAERDPDNARWQDVLAEGLTHLALWSALDRERGSALTQLAHVKALRDALTERHPDFAANRAALTRLERLERDVRAGRTPALSNDSTTPWR